MSPVGCFFFCSCFCEIEEVPLYSQGTGSLYHDLNLSNAFSASIRPCDFLFFPSLAFDMIGCIGWFSNIEPALHTWNKSHLAVGYYFFHTLLRGILLRSFASKFVKDIGWQSFVCVCVLCLVRFWYQGNTGLIKQVGKCSLLFSGRNCVKLMLIL